MATYKVVSGCGDSISDGLQSEEQATRIATDWVRESSDPLATASVYDRSTACTESCPGEGTCEHVLYSISAAEVAADASVVDYDTSDRVEGDCSVSLYQASQAAAPTGAVAAYRDAAGVWQYLREDEVEHYRRSLRETVVTVYVED